MEAEYMLQYVILTKVNKHQNIFIPKMGDWSIMFFKVVIQLDK